MKIIINNVEFGFDLGCRILKLKHDECPMDELKDIWDDIVPCTFSEISLLPNLEQRRIGILHLGIETIVKSVNPKLLSKKTLKKKTSWVNENGELVEHNFNDTYELYEVEGDVFSQNLQNSWQKVDSCYYVRCKDTSTDREYLIWVDLQSVYSTNKVGESWEFGSNKNKINAIQCIAWTIQTNVPKDKIAKIIRQGDCIMIKPKGNYVPLDNPRHLTEQEYVKLLVAES
jgi:hypothetical protein